MFLAAVAAVEAQQTHLKVGDRAPDFALPNADGKLITLSEQTASGPLYSFSIEVFCGACRQLTSLS